MRKIEPIKNPYIPEEYENSMQCCKKDEQKIIDAGAPREWFTKYVALDLTNATVIRDDITDSYTPQGGCVYNGYIYRAMVKEDEEPAIVQKIRISDGVIVTERQHVLGHANDMFVKNGVLHVLHSSSTGIVYRLNLDTLAYIGTNEGQPPSVTRWGQAHNATDNLDVIGTVGSAYFSVYNGDTGKFMYRIKPDNAYSGLVRQGIFCDENYIGVVLDNHYGAVEGDVGGSRVMFYTWNGMFIKSVYIPIKEIEWADYVDGVLYFGTYEGRDPNDVKSGFIYSIPFDLYPNQTVLTGRPTDVSGGLNNLQRLPEGTPVRLWDGNVSEGVITLHTVGSRLRVDEDNPFRYLLFEFEGANSQTFIWFPKNNGVVALREVDLTAAVEDSNIRIREARLIFNHTAQTFTIDSVIIEEIKHDKSESKITITKSPTGIDGIKVKSIWGIV